MKYYKHPETGDVKAFKNEAERKEWGEPGLVEMTPKEVEGHLNPAESLEEFSTRQRAEIDAASVAALDQVRSDYPDYEQLSWERQEREARDGGGPLIQAIADARGLSLEELISRIIAKADAYQAAAGVVIGRRQALRDQIDAIEVSEDLDDDEKRRAIEAITW